MAELLREKRPDDAPTTFGHQEAARDVIIKKWALLWKSILRSTLGKTYRPYSHFIRVLDLQDLETLLEDNKFRGNIERSVYSIDYLGISCLDGLGHFSVVIWHPSISGWTLPLLVIREGNLSRFLIMCLSSMR